MPEYVPKPREERSATSFPPKRSFGIHGGPKKPGRSHRHQEPKMQEPIRRGLAY